MPSQRNKLPDRWLDYKNTGTILQGTRFLPIKVPLDEKFTTSFPEHRFTSQDFLESIKKKGLKVGLVIDLTFTSKYYNPQQFLQHGIRHRKIFMPGHVIPERRIVNQFAAAVKEFEENNTENDDLIVVHCTHGLNRTGYLVCKYLIEEKSLSPKEAISLFNQARGHAIERKNYLTDLVESSSTQKNDTFASSVNMSNEHFPRYTKNNDYGKFQLRQSSNFASTSAHHHRMPQRRGASYKPHPYPIYHNTSRSYPRTSNSEYNYDRSYQQDYSSHNRPDYHHPRHTFYEEPIYSEQERYSFKMSTSHSNYSYYPHNSRSRPQQGHNKQGHRGRDYYC